MGAGDGGGRRGQERQEGEEDLAGLVCDAMKGRGRGCCRCSTQSRYNANTASDLMASMDQDEKTGASSKL